MLTRQDCIYRFQGTYDYVFILDSDDYFIPLLPNAKTLDYYVKNYCHFGGACVFKWVEFYPDCGVQWERLGQHGNVTNILVSHASKQLTQTKTIHRVSALLDAGAHQAMLLLDGYRQKHIPQSVAYVAHVRQNRKPRGGMQAC